jgi:hypothetical protein
MNLLPSVNQHHSVTLFLRRLDDYRLALGIIPHCVQEVPHLVGELNHVVGLDEIIAELKKVMGDWHIQPLLLGLHKQGRM